MAERDPRQGEPHPGEAPSAAHGQHEAASPHKGGPAPAGSGVAYEGGPALTDASRPGHESSGANQPAGRFVAEHAHETTDIGLKGITTFFIWFVIIGLGLHVLVWFIFQGLVAHVNEQVGTGEPTLEQVSKRPPPPEPRLQPSFKYHQHTPAEDLAIMREQNQWILSHPAEKGNGVARISIDRAIALVAERGLPTTQPVENGSSGGRVFLPGGAGEQGGVTGGGETAPPAPSEPMETPSRGSTRP